MFDILRKGWQMFSSAFFAGELSKLRCRFGSHRRSRRRARKIDGVFVSNCRDCGARMIRDADGVWNLSGRR